LRVQRVTALEQHAAARIAAVEEEIEKAQVRHEAALGVALAIDRMREALPDHADAGAAHLLDVEIVRRAARAREVRPRAELVAQIDQALGLAGSELKRRRPQDRRPDPERAARELEHREIE